MAPPDGPRTDEEEDRALAGVRRAVEADLRRGRAPAQIVNDLQKGGLKRVEAEDIVARARRSASERLGAAPPPKPAVPLPPPRPPEPEVPIPIAPARTAVPPARRPAAGPRRWTGRRVVATALAVAALLAGAVAGPRWVRQQLLQRSERQALADVRAFASERATAAQGNAGAFPAPAAREERRGDYVFRFYGDQPVPAAPTQPAYRAYAYVATPVAPAPGGARSFAVYSYLDGVYARRDGAPPTVEDEKIDAR
jgi:hypothetical protein